MLRDLQRLRVLQKLHVRFEDGAGEEELQPWELAMLETFGPEWARAAGERDMKETEYEDSGLPRVTLRHREQVAELEETWLGAKWR